VVRDVAATWYQRALDYLRRPAIVAAAASVAALPAGPVIQAPVTGEKGVTGTGNRYGDLQVESNLKLVHQLAYGQAGTREWGFWEEARHTDVAVATGLDFVIAPLRDARADIEAPDPKLNKDGQAQADFLAWSKDRVEPGWAEFLSQMGRGSLGSGFSLFEDVWGQAVFPQLPGGQGFVISKLAERLPSSIHQNGWHPDEKGQLAFVRQVNPYGLRPGNAIGDIDIPAGKLELFSWNRSGDNYLGFSAFRPSYHLIRVRKELAKLIGISLVRESAGIPIAVSQAGAANLSPDERKSLEKFLANIVAHENANIVMPYGWDLKWTFSPPSSRVACIEAFNALGLLILQSVGAQQVVLGTGSTGSRSVGEVHSAQARAFLGGIFAMAEGVLNGVANRPYTGWTRKQIDANWGAQLAYPTLKLSPRRPEMDPEQLFTALQKATQTGVIKIRASDENVARERLGMAPVDEHEDEESETPEHEAAEGETPEKDPMSAAGAPTGPGVPAVAGAVTDVKAQDTALNGAQSAEARALLESCAQKNLPFETTELLLVITLRITPEQASKLVEPLKKFPSPKPPPPPAPFGGGSPGEPPSKPDDVQTPAQKNESEPTTKATAAFTPRRPLRASEQALDLEAIANLFDTRREVFADGVKPLVAEALTKALPDVKAAMVDGDATDVAEKVKLDMTRIDAFVGEYLNELRAEGYRHVSRESLHRTPLRAAEEEQDDRRPTPEMSDEAHAETEAALAPIRKHLVRRMGQRLSSDLEKEAIDVLRTGGEPADVITQALERQVNSGAFKQDAGLVTAKAFSLGREEFAAEYGDRISTVELSAVLDSGTCSPCNQLDGSVFDFGSDEDERYTPPLTRDCDGGDNCRCLKIFNFSRGEA